MPESESSSCAARNTHDWDAIVERHGPLVWKTVYRVIDDYTDALDCYQEVFVEAFESSRGRAVEHWPSLLKWLAVRRAIDRVRQRTRMGKREVLSLALVNSVPSAVEPHELAEFQELLDAVVLDLAALPRIQAEAFWLGCVEQMSYSEVAELLGVERDSVKVLVHRVRQHLRKSLRTYFKGAKDHATER